MMDNETYGDRPRIGVSAGCRDGKVVLNETYVLSVLRAGGVPVVLPQADDVSVAASLVGAVDALLLSGGEDVDPLSYGVPRRDGLGEVNPARDRSELALLRAAHERGMPVLGICRGVHVINVFHGGTLYQDLATEFEGAMLHRQTTDPFAPYHAVSVEPGSRLGRLFGGADCVNVNSLHHQAVMDPAPGFKVVARAPDGVVEAVEGPPELNVLAVQFHPEYFASRGDGTFLPLFRDLVARAAAFCR